eukprot:3026710-Amphidinium_carterae.1
MSIQTLLSLRLRRLRHSHPQGHPEALLAALVNWKLRLMVSPMCGHCFSYDKANFHEHGMAHR